MGSSLSAISDDWDDYQYLCRKHNTKMEDLYSTHHDWLENLDRGRTKLSYIAYKKIKDKEKMKREIENLENEIAKKQKELKNLKNETR